MLKEILFNKVVLGAGIGLVLVIVAKFVNEKELRAKGEMIADWLKSKADKHGHFVSKYMGGKFGKKLWEKIESFIQKCGLALAAGLWKHGFPYLAPFNRALDADDTAGPGGQAELPLAPPPELSGRARHQVE